MFQSGFCFTRFVGFIDKETTCYINPPLLLWTMNAYRHAHSNQNRVKHKKKIIVSQRVRQHFSDRRQIQLVMVTTNDSNEMISHAVQFIPPGGFN